MSKKKKNNNNKIMMGICIGVIVIALIVGLCMIFKNKEPNSKNVTEYNVNEIVKTVKLDKEAAENIVRVLEDHNITEKITVKDYSVEKHDSQNSQINTDVYTIKIAEESGNKYTITVNGDGMFGSIQNERGEYIYYEED